jgi:hypothetical protein
MDQALNPGHLDLLAAGTELLQREGAYLDEQRWDDWLALFVPDCEYWVPSWKDEQTLTGDPQTELSHIYATARGTGGPGGAHPLAALSGLTPMPHQPYLGQRAAARGARRER